MSTVKDLVKIGVNPKVIARSGQQARRPPWLRVKVQHTEGFNEVKSLLGDLKLNTVCEEARCPNIWECWGKHRTATFMILGEICTRACRYCSVTSARPERVDLHEPEHVAEAVARMKLAHTVITSVDRDDLEDLGAGHWVETIQAIQKKSPQTRIEILTPDFIGDYQQLRRVLDTHPAVFSHNVETVPRLYRKLRSKGIYERCLELLGRLDAYRLEQNIAMTTKTGLMCGLGETKDEILQVMDDLRSVNVDVFTIGQYLNPTKKHFPVQRFYAPEEFDVLKEEGLKRGFKNVVSGPLVRSSYHAHEHVPEAILK